MSWYTDYKSSLKMIWVEETIDLLFYRPIAFILVKLVYNTRITPDDLTLAAIITGISSGIVLAFGSSSTATAGGLLLFLFVVLDCSDGQLARLKGSGTKIGRLLDGIADYTVTAAVYIGIAVGYSKAPGQPAFMVPLLALSGASIILHSALVDYYRTRFLNIVRHSDNSFNDGMTEFRRAYQDTKGHIRKLPVRVIIFIYLLYSKIQRRVIGVKKIDRNYSYSPEEYFVKNRVIIKFWLLIGPSSIRTSLIVCTLFERFDIFFWITIIAFNFLALILGLTQRYIDRER